MKTTPVLWLAIFLTGTSASLALADCEADLLQLESAMAAPGLKPEMQASLKKAGEDASSALRKDDDATCHKLVTEAIAAASGAPPAAAAPTSAAMPGALGDLSAFKTIVDDVSAKVATGDIAGANTRITDLETAWDAARPKLHALNAQSWDALDKSIDGALKALRAPTPDGPVVKAALAQLTATMEQMK